MRAFSHRGRPLTGIGIDRLVIRIARRVLDRDVDELFLGDRLVRRGAARAARRFRLRRHGRLVLIVKERLVSVIRDVLRLAVRAPPCDDLADRQIHTAEHAGHECRHRQRQRRVHADAGLEQIAHAAGNHAAGGERLTTIIELADDRAERLRRKCNTAEHQVHDRAEQRRDQQRRRHAQAEVPLRIAHKDPSQQQHRKRERPIAPAHNAGQEARKAVDDDALGVKQAKKREQRQHDAHDGIRPRRRSLRRRGRCSRLLFRRGSFSSAGAGFFAEPVFFLDDEVAM